MWKTIVCTVQGKGHQSKGLPCQDKVFEVHIGNASAVSLADGAGSARLSHYGAESATRAAAEVLTRDFETFLTEPDGRLVKLKFLFEVQNAIKHESEARECEMRDLACTLLCAAANDEHFMLAHVGDGVIGYLKNGEVKVASHPENGEYSNATVFVTSGKAAQSMKLFKGKTDGIRGFVLMSDGTETALYHKQSGELAPALKRMMQLCRLLPKERLEQMLDDVLKNTVSRVTNDDCSIAFLVDAPDNLDAYLSLSKEEKCDMLGIGVNTRTAAKRIARYDKLLTFLQLSRTLTQIARFLHVKHVYAHRHLMRLHYNGFVEQRGVRYQAVPTLRT